MWVWRNRLPGSIPDKTPVIDSLQEKHDPGYLADIWREIMALRGNIPEILMFPISSVVPSSVLV